jgi:hypothetical protein
MAMNFDSYDAAYDFATIQYQKYLDKINSKDSPSKTKPKEYVPHLDKLERTGFANKGDSVIAHPDDLQKTFNFFGGEFGNWESDKERIQNVNLSYDAFCDLARALNISVKDVALNHTLSIAYGARGRGNALAHYESNYKVINLTRLKGAGSLAHEWGHALDNYLFNVTYPDKESSMNIDSLNAGQNFLSTSSDSSTRFKLNPLIADLVDKMKYDENRNCTKFFDDAKFLDASFHKSNSYYSTNYEMFARAFACYVTDKLSDMGSKNDYLSGHSDLGTYPGSMFGIPDKEFYTYPLGEERQVINDAFDKLISDVKERGILHNFDEKEISLLPQTIKQIEMQNIVSKIYDNLKITSNPTLLPSKETFIKDFIDNYSYDDAIKQLDITTKNKQVFEKTQKQKEYDVELYTGADGQMSLFDMSDAKPKSKNQTKSKNDDLER